MPDRVNAIMKRKNAEWAAEQKAKTMTRNEITKSLDRLKNVDAIMLHSNWIYGNLSNVKHLMRNIRYTLDLLEKQIKEDLFKNL